MKLFVILTSEYDVLQAFLEEKLITSLQYPLEKNEENYLIYIVKGRIAALTLVEYDNKLNGLFHYKIDIKHITETDERISVPFTIPIPENQPLNLSEKEIQKTINLIQNCTYSFHYYMTNAEDLFLTESKKIQRKKQKELLNISSQSILENTKYTNISEPHLKAQYILKNLADIVEVEPFIAKNDQHKVFNDEYLGSGTIDLFPYDKIPNDAKNIISLIDIIWFKNNVPQAAFEIETTTSISSGLLRFSDLIYNLNIPVDLYIVTTRSRERKLKKELNRAIFKNTGISQRCKIIFIDELESLYELVKPLNGYIKPNILDRISYDFSYFEEI